MPIFRINDTASCLLSDARHCVTLFLTGLLAPNWRSGSRNSDLRHIRWLPCVSARLNSGDFNDRALSRSFFSPFVFLPYLAAFVLSLISFHTTYYGMRSFYGLGTTTSQGKSTVSDPIANSISQYLSIDIDNLFALCFAAVVQGGILLASAYLFRIVFDRQDRAGERGSRFLPYFVSTVLLLLLPISIIFSYGARLEWQIGSEQKSVIQASSAYSDATDMLNTLKSMLREEGQRLSTSTSELSSFKSFQDNMNQLAAAVARAPQPCSPT